MHRLIAVVMLFGLCCGGGAPAAPVPTSQTVDVLDFLIGDPSLWPRVGSHSQNQSVDRTRNEVCWVKYANPRTFECWRWDDNFVYHVVDHAIDGNTGESYSFSDGRWMPRHLSGTWSLDVANNQIVWFDPACAVDAVKSHVFPYRLRAWIENARDAGPEIGLRETLVLEYQPYDPAGAAGSAEHFYFARGAGWYEWDRDATRDVFNRVGGPARSPAREIVCRGL
jgi:hypothetical protein